MVICNQCIKSLSEMLFIEMNTEDCAIPHPMHCMICGLVGLLVNAIFVEAISHNQNQSSILMQSANASVSRVRGSRCG